MERHRGTIRLKPETGKKISLQKQKPGPLPDSLKSHQPGTLLTAASPWQLLSENHNIRLAKSASGGQQASILLHLQKAYGNKYVQNLMRSIQVDKKLTAGPPNDACEQEADRVSEAVSSQMISQTQQQAEKDELQSRPVLQQQAAGAQQGISPEIESRITAARTGGEHLDDHIRVPLQKALGADFSGVKIHADGNADSLNKSLQARAFTTGADIFFKSGEYSPLSSSGQKLIAHELTHVVQQGSARTLKSTEREGGSSSTRDITHPKATIQRETVKELRELWEQKIKKTGGNKPSSKKIKKETGTGKREDNKKKAGPAVPVRWYKIWSEAEKERQKHWQPLISTMNTMLTEGGSPGWFARTTLLGFKQKSPFVRILEDVNDYHNRAINCHQKREMSPDDFRFQLETLEHVSSLIETWNQKYNRWKPKTRDAKRGRKEALDRLKQEIETEKSERLEVIRPWVTHKTLTLDREEGKIKGGSALERLDPEHREAVLLAGLYPVWQSSGSRLQFFAWVTNLEKEKNETLLKQLWIKEKMSKDRETDPKKRKARAEVYLADPAKYKYPQWKAQFLQNLKSEKLVERIQYANKDFQRDQFLLAFDGSGAYYAKRGTKKEYFTKKCIYVMSPEGQFYAGKEQDEGAKDLVYHHSSFLGGAAIGAAGQIYISGSQIVIDIESGHYRPETQHIVNAIKGMEKNGVSLKKLNVAPLFENKNWLSNAEDFMKGMKALQAGLPMSNADVKRVLPRYFASLPGLKEEEKARQVEELRKIARKLVF